jgi:hypothetical protein
MVMSGWQGISWGVVSLLGGTLTHHYCVAGTTSFTSPGISLLWILLLIVGGTAETFFYIRKARRNRIPLLSPVVKNVMIGFTAFIVLGGIFHWIFQHLGRFHYIPGSWMLILGAGSIFIGLFSIMEIWVLGLVLMSGGVLAVGPFLGASYLMLALFGGIGSILWGIWVNHRLGG